MFGIPEWAIGVGAVVTLIYVLQVTAGRLLPPGHRRRSYSLKGDASAELEDVQARLAELEDLKHRVGELEERVDFAERLLAQKREGERLPPA